MKKLFYTIITFVLLFSCMNMVGAVEFKAPKSYPLTGIDGKSEYIGALEINDYTFIGFGSTNSSNFSVPNNISQTNVGFGGLTTFVDFKDLSEISWNAIQGGDSDETLYCGDIDNENSYIIVGGSESDYYTNEQNEEVVSVGGTFIKVESTNGEKILSQKYTKTEALSDLIILSDGNYLAAGNKDGNAQFLKIKSTGSLHWDKPIEIAKHNSDYSFKTTKVNELTNGDYVMSGIVYHEKGNSYFLARYTKKGAKILFKNYFSTSTIGYTPVGLYGDLDGGYTLILSNGNLLSIVRYSTSNKVLWENIIILEEGSKVISSDISSANEYIILISNDNKYAIKKYADSKSEEMWSYGHSIANDYSNIIETEEGNILLSGKSGDTALLVLLESIRVNNLKVISSNYNEATISYDELDGYTGYEIYVSSKKYDNYTLLTETEELSYTHGSLKAGSTYYYKVRAFKEVSEEKEYSDFTNPKGVKIVPNEPTNLHVTDVGVTYVRMEWDAVEGATEYAIYRSTSGEENSYSRIATISGTKTAYRNTGRYANTTYYYKIKALRKYASKKYAYSDYSNSAYGTPHFEDPVISASDGHYRYNQINIQAVPGATSYKIYKFVDTNENEVIDSGELVTVGTTSKLVYYDKEINNVGKEINYVVKGYRKFGKKTYRYSNPSNVISMTRVDDTINYSLIKGTGATVNMTISPVVNATYYSIYRATSKKGKYSFYKKAVVVDNNDLIVNLSQSYNKTYYYKIKAYQLLDGKSDYSDYSPIKSIKITK